VLRFWSDSSSTRRKSRKEHFPLSKKKVIASILCEWKLGIVFYFFDMIAWSPLAYTTWHTWLTRDAASKRLYMRLVDSYSTTRQVPRRTCFCLLARVTMTTKGRRTLVILMCPSLSSKGQVVRQFQLVHKFIRSQLAASYSYSHSWERTKSIFFILPPKAKLSGVEICIPPHFSQLGTTATKSITFSCIYM